MPYTGSFCTESERGGTLSQIASSGRPSISSEPFGTRIALATLGAATGTAGSAAFGGAEALTVIAKASAPAAAKIHRFTWLGF